MRLKGSLKVLPPLYLLPPLSMMEKNKKFKPTSSENLKNNSPKITKALQ